MKDWENLCGLIIGMRIKPFGKYQGMAFTIFTIFLSKNWKKKYLCDDPLIILKI